MAAHVAGKDDVLVRAAPPLKETEDWRWFLRGEETQDVLGALRRHGRTGRPLGLPRFPERPENRPGRLLRRQKPARSPSEISKVSPQHQSELRSSVKPERSLHLGQRRFCVYSAYRPGAP